MQKILLVQGSSSDDPYADQITQCLQSARIPYDRRISSAHNTPKPLQRLLDIYERSEDEIVAISVAGLSDALSGTIAARRVFPTIACPPDAKKYGEAKKFSSTATPKGITVHYASSPEEAVEMAKQIFSTYDFSQKNELKNQALAKRNQILMDDARMQGVEDPLPLLLWKMGKVRDIYDLGTRLLIDSSDRISAFDVVSVTRIEGKGTALNQLNAWWLKNSKQRFPNHRIGEPDITMMLVKKAERINIEWIARDYLYGSMYGDYEGGQREFWEYKLPSGMQRAEKLPERMFTPTTKAEGGKHDVPITKAEAMDEGLVTAEEWNQLREATFDLYEYYARIANQRGLILPDFKLEFGRYRGRLIQIDEAPTHDSAGIWIKSLYEVGKKQEAHALDKQFYRQFLIDSGVDSKNPPRPLPEIPPLVVQEIQKRVNGAYEVFTGKTSLQNLNLKSLEEVEMELKGESKF